MLTGVGIQTSTTRDNYGRIVDSTLSEKDNQGAWRANRRRYSRWNEDVDTTWQSRLLEVEEEMPTSSGSMRLVSESQFDYDEYSLTDRGTVLQQASGYGPSNNDRGNLTTVRRHLID